MSIIVRVQVLEIYQGFLYFYVANQPMHTEKWGREKEARFLWLKSFDIEVKSVVCLLFYGNNVYIEISQDK